jgi:hypothetical protein
LYGWGIFYSFSSLVPFIKKARITLPAFQCRKHDTSTTYQKKEPPVAQYYFWSRIYKTHLTYKTIKYRELLSNIPKTQWHGGKAAKIIIVFFFNI